ncbi:hypothetical protein DRQ33_08765 [bacterium]|nr:MAG: hypothetical protein DRQ33_08765 [bacterium]
MKIYSKSTISIFTVLLVLLPVLVFGQAKVGTAAGQFLEISPSPRAEGMSSAFIGVADDIYTIYYNPAGLAWQYQRQAAFAHTMMYADINMEWAAFSMPMFGGVLGISAMALNAGEMDETDPKHPEGTGRTFSAGALSTGITYSRALTDRFSIGINAKYIGEYLADVNAEGWGMDIGTYFKTAFRDIRLGMILGNFGPDLEYLQQSYPLPMVFRFGGAGEIINGENHRITVDIEGSHPNDNLEKFQVGMEYAFREFAFIRGGYKIQYDNERFTGGAGVKIPIGGLIARVDYSFTYFEYVPGVHRFGLAVGF